MASCRRSVAGDLEAVRRDRRTAPIAVKAPDRPVRRRARPDAPRRRRTAGSRPTTSTWSSSPTSPAPRVERPGHDGHDAVLRFAPGDFARQSWSGPVADRPARSTARARASSSTASRCPRRSSKAEAESLSLRFELASKAGRREGRLARAEEPAGLPADRRPQVADDARRSTINGHEVAPRGPAPTTRPTPAACSRTWRGSTTAATASWSRLGGTLPDGRPGRPRRRQAAGDPPGRARRRRASPAASALSAPRRGVLRSTRRSCSRTRGPAPGRPRRRARRAGGDRRRRGGARRPDHAGRLARASPTRGPTRRPTPAPAGPIPGSTTPHGSAAPPGFGTGGHAGPPGQHPLGFRRDLAPDDRRLPRLARTTPR